jgi:hypothetical protein
MENKIENKMENKIVEDFLVKHNILRLYLQNAKYKTNLEIYGLETPDENVSFFKKDYYFDRYPYMVLEVDIYNKKKGIIHNEFIELRVCFTRNKDKLINNIKMAILMYCEDMEYKEEHHKTIIDFIDYIDDMIINRKMDWNIYASG